MSNLDAEFAELIDTVGHRRAGILATTAHQIAAEIRTAADALGTAGVGPGQRHILAALPACTYAQSRFWRYQFADCASRLAEDTERWGAPVPRCTGEEMALHLILHRTTTDTGHSWSDLAEDLFQDNDVLTLYDIPVDAVTGPIGAVQLTPAQWFTEFTTPFPLPPRP